MTRRQLSRHPFIFTPTQNLVIPRGGASRLSVWCDSLDNAAASVSAYAQTPKDFAYSGVVTSDNSASGAATYNDPGSPRGGTTFLAGALEYTMQGIGITLYPFVAGVPQWLSNSANAVFHHLTTWTVECVFRTGSDVNTLQLLFISTGGPSTTYVYCAITGSFLRLVNSNGTIFNGPFVNPNTVYHLIVTCNAGAITWYLNTASSAGGTYVAVALGINAGLYMASNVSGGQPFLGTIGAFNVMQSYVLPVNYVNNHYYAAFLYAISELISTLTLSTYGTTGVLTYGEGYTTPLPDALVLGCTGRMLLTYRAEE